MRTRMEELLSAGVPRRLVTPEGDLLFLFTSYYHSALYVVVEGWQDLDLSDTEIDRLLASDNVGLLKRFPPRDVSFSTRVP